MSSLPEDLYLQILLRLPVKSTFVCNCVCKSWLALISEPNFAEMHLDLISDRNISSYLMVIGLDMCNNFIYSINYDSLNPSEWEKSVFTEMCYPYESLGYAVSILGSSNGLFCLMVFDNFNPDGKGKKFFFCVWNPTTREYKKINKPTADGIDFDKILMCAFGYDQINDAYKLAIGVDSSDENNTAVYVYTLEADSWKSAVIVPYYFCSYGTSGVPVNGEFHFLADRGQGMLIVSFNISEERFTKIKLSTKLEVNGHCLIAEAVLDGCLCVLAQFRANTVADDDNHPARLEVWVMQDYGVRESWTKRYVLTHEILTGKIMGRFFPLRFISASKSGEILVNMLGRIILYDPKDGSVFERDMGTVRGPSSEVSYFESLVSVNSGRYVGKGQMEESIEPEEA